MPSPPRCAVLLAVMCLVACRSQPVQDLAAEPASAAEPAGSNEPVRVTLPPPAPSGSVSLEQALLTRRSQRQFAPTPLPLAELGQLGWAAQGVTEPADGYRTAPSSGATYPMELHFVTADGVLHYVPAAHAFDRYSGRDVRGALARAAGGQAAVRLAACSVVIVSMTARTRGKYGERAVRYVALEAGHIGQNLLLQATARGLVGVPIGAFDDAAVSRVLRLPPEADPLYIIALGYPK